MKTYTDKRGWTYRVMQGLGNVYKARYHRPEFKKGTGWKCVGVLPWRNTMEEAQADLDEYAKKHKMKEDEQ